MRRACVLAGVLALAAGASGCGTGDVVPVSGRVTLDGKPLPGVTVHFYPNGTKEKPDPGYPSESAEVTDADGRFVLAVPRTGQAGAVIGPHTVSVNTPVRPDHPVYTDSSACYYDPLPPKYSTPSSLTFEVPPGGTTEANFDLKTDPNYHPPRK